MEKFSYFKIGIFVISAVVIGVIGVVVLGVGTIFQKKSIVETYIDESVQGLDVGSPLKFRGVPVGRVEQISLTSAEYATKREYVVVRMSISSNMFQFQVNDPKSEQLTENANLEKMGGQANTLLNELRETNRQINALVSNPELKTAIADASASAG